MWEFHGFASGMLAGDKLLTYLSHYLVLTILMYIFI